MPPFASPVNLLLSAVVAAVILADVPPPCTPLDLHPVTSAIVASVHDASCTTATGFSLVDFFVEPPSSPTTSLSVDTFNLVASTPSCMSLFQDMESIRLLKRRCTHWGIALDKLIRLDFFQWVLIKSQSPQGDTRFLSVPSPPSSSSTTTTSPPTFIVAAAGSRLAQDTSLLDDGTPTMVPPAPASNTPEVAVILVSIVAVAVIVVGAFVAAMKVL
ncbi:Aste57867_16954 [Aphanomyces stellatus]|uniref:Aste57867_16954 protein n=1 Tax=Aphanomyces stellatus TaxID=120398 RepID=A0A485L871_9STRA|nr:hypothetical protein As57867_016896 [Aphanomyces stellatus]VFT93716.1 Aste57867_16954 [Aphanomyces stellatus]